MTEMCQRPQIAQLNMRADHWLKPIRICRRRQSRQSSVYFPLDLRQLAGEFPLQSPPTVLLLGPGLPEPPFNPSMQIQRQKHRFDQVLTSSSGNELLRRLMGSGTISAPRFTNQGENGLLW